MFEDVTRGGSGDEEGRRKRAVAVGGALLATSVMLLGAALLFGWAYQYRRNSFHHERLQRMMDKEPTAGQVTEGLRAEGVTLVARAATRDELRRVLESRPAAAEGAVLERHQPGTETLVFDVGEILYFLYFDGEGVMRDFLCLSASQSRH